LFRNGRGTIIVGWTRTARIRVADLQRVRPRLTLQAVDNTDSSDLVAIRACITQNRGQAFERTVGTGGANGTLREISDTRPVGKRAGWA
jgi:hypothetical protein